MDYKLVVLFADGYTEEIGCATQTDVENHAVQIIRRGLTVKNAVAEESVMVVSMTLILPNRTAG